ncbi:hypothetical protein DU478_18855 [Thalassococcus profundi]|uniref:ZIP Zinc transporter n=1 Tax=Thalassococcus profundi TaxID=2282382 RepID=A0A369TGZ8_9RHOB|nr:hypothetical protein [Thalassococcus profundi]RDD64629.1 hypothetical protein DU478_18855 [Thalassococcus profundi]
MALVAFLIAGVFAAVHVGIGVLRFLDVTPRSRWLSASGGVAVAYVFLHILPELALHRTVFAEALDTDAERAEALVYSLALAGLVVFYGLERTVKTSRRGGAVPGAGTFWLHIGSFTVYNVIVGYLLLHRESDGAWSLAIYACAMILHFITTDHGLRADHKARYDTHARWILAAAVMAGWALGMWVTLPEFWIGGLFAFLAGGIVLNVLKEELPEERESRLWPFVFSAVGYAAVLLAI